MATKKLLKKFLEDEKSGGVALISCTIISLLLANFFIGQDYIDFWQTEVAGLTFELWINDGLMTIFFLLIGLELKREVFSGQLSKPKDAMLPIFGAIGGMVIPALIYIYFNFGTSTSSGAGIPMATDIAFALGVLSLLGKRVPLALRIFLTALATIDDLGAILVIAFFYTTGLSITYLLIALGIFGVLLLLNKLKVKNLIPYIIGGLVMWFFMLHSGVHATITGVLLAFAIPYGKGEEGTPSYIMENVLSKPVNFIILPIFALANTAFAVVGDFGEVLTSHYGLGIALGLIVGKPLGIFGLSFIAAKAGWCSLPSGISWKNIFAVGMLGGIGFTMSIFITLLAFDDITIIDHAKLIILFSSLIAGILGLITLKLELRHQKNNDKSALQNA